MGLGNYNADTKVYCLHYSPCLIYICIQQRRNMGKLLKFLYQLYWKRRHNLVNEMDEGIHETQVGGVEEEVDQRDSIYSSIKKFKKHLKCVFTILSNFQLLFSIWYFKNCYLILCLLRFIFHSKDIKIIWYWWAFPNFDEESSLDFKRIGYWFCDLWLVSFV